jgi:hypothetical protein
MEMNRRITNPAKQIFALVYLVHLVTMKKHKQLLTIFLLFFSFISNGQYKSSPFEHLPSLQREYGKINDSLFKYFVEYDSIIQNCDEALDIEIWNRFNSSTSSEKIIIKLFKKGGNDEMKLIEFDLKSLKDSLILGVVNRDRFICFLKDGQLKYYSSSRKYDDTWCQSGPHIQNAVYWGYSVQEIYTSNDNLLLIDSDKSYSFLNFKSNKLFSTYLINYYNNCVFCEFCSINPFNLQESYCNTSDYSSESIQKMNQQFERVKSEKVRLEEIYRRVKKSNLFKKF